MSHNTFSHLGLVCLLILSAPTGRAYAADDVKTAFDSLYGLRIKAAMATASSKDDIALSAQLLEVARQSTENVRLLTLLCESSAVLGSKGISGYPSAIGALELLSKHAPARKPDVHEKIVPLRRKLFFAARGKAKTEIGLRLIDDYQRMATARLGDSDARGAIVAYRDALRIATAINSDKKTVINEAIRAARSQLVLFSEIRRLKSQLKAKENDPAIAKKLVMIYLVDMDMPSKARPFTFLLSDDDLKKKVAVASKPIANISQSEARLMGQWYHGLSATAGTNPAKARMLIRARAYYSSYQIKAEKPDGLIKLALSDIEATLKKLKVSTTSSSLAKSGNRIGATIDLLKVVDVKKHVTGDSKWTLNKTGLYCPEGKAQRRCYIPVSVQGSYELALEITRKKIGGHIAVILPIGKSTVMYYMGYGGHSMFAPIAGARAYSKNNPTRVEGEAKTGQKYLYKFTVLIKGKQCQLKVERDGKQLTKWEGPLAKVGSSSKNDGAATPNLAFHLNYGSMTIHRAKIRMLTGRIARLE